MARRRPAIGGNPTRSTKGTNSPKATVTSAPGTRKRASRVGKASCSVRVSPDPELTVTLGGNVSRFGP
jgi:hypothetical protein